MSYSLTEIEALAKRAARGAGLPWGLAEEAAMAVRWLAAFGLDGPALLAGLLTQDQGTGFADMTLVTLDGVWCGEAGRLNPLIAGTALADTAARLKTDGPVMMQNVSYPLLLLPFAAAAAAAARLNAPISLEWNGVYVASDDRNYSVKTGDAMLQTPIAVRVTCTANAEMPMPVKPAMRGQISQASLDCLHEFAGQSFVPATDASREMGAGAGLTDND